MIIKSLLLLLCLLFFVAVFESILSKFKKDNEASRKLIHVAHGVGLAILAFIVPLNFILAIEIINLICMFGARYLFKHLDGRLPLIHYLGKMYKVGRQSYGDIFFPISVMIVALIANTKWEFFAAILVLGLADAVAALIGKRFGKSTTYLVFGQKKSLAGSAAFFVVTLAVILVYMAYGEATGHQIALLVAIGLSLILTGVENVGIYGSDNLLLPIAAVVLLNRF